MLFMLTPEIKTNFILKEIGIKRYLLRSKMPNSSEKSCHYYQKGIILALLDKPFDNFVKEDQDLIKAIIQSTKQDKGKEVFETVFFSSSEELQGKINNLSTLKLIISFGDVLRGLEFNSESINAPSINELNENKELKKGLWVEIKHTLNL